MTDDAPREGTPPETGSPAERDDRDPYERAPSFAANFPRRESAPELDALVRAFVLGDYRQVRRDAPKVIRSSDSEPVKQAAALLVARTKADPLAKLVLVLTAALLVLLTVWWERKSGPVPPQPEPIPAPERK